ARPWTRPSQGALDANFTIDSCDHLDRSCGLLHHCVDRWIASHGAGTPQPAGAAHRVQRLRHSGRNRGHLGWSPWRELGRDNRPSLRRAGVVAPTSVGTRRSPRSGGGGPVTNGPVKNSPVKNSPVKNSAARAGAREPEAVAPDLVFSHPARMQATPE